MPADLLRIVTEPGGEPVFDLADGFTYSYVPDSLTIDTTGMAGSGTGGIWLDPGGGYTTASDERYGGSHVDFDRRPNAVLTWSAILMYPPGAPASAPNTALALAQLAAEVERADPPGSRYIEWRRYGCDESLYYERRGPGLTTITERWENGEAAKVTVQMPIAPAALGPPLTVTLGEQETPGVWTLPNPGGVLPAKMDVQLDTVPSLNFGLLAATTAPFGIYNAQTLEALGAWGLVSDATARGGEKLSVYPPTAGAAYFAWAVVDGTEAWLDEYEYEGDLLIELWARMNWNATYMGAPQASVDVRTPDALIASSSLDFGSAGKALVNARAGAGWGLYRLGVCRIPPEDGWLVGVEIAPPDTLSSYLGTTLDLDYLMLAPARWRACTPTAVEADDGTYPSLTPAPGASGATTYSKLIRSDLSGEGGIESPTHQDRGMGGSPLRCPPVAGAKLLVAASANVPDDPTSDSSFDEPAAVTPTVTLTPRYRLLDAL